MIIPVQIISENDEYKSYCDKLKKSLKEDELSENESIYVINTLRNNIRRIGNDCVTNIRISVNGKNKSFNDIYDFCGGTFSKEIKLNSGFTVKIGFNYD